MRNELDFEQADYGTRVSGRFCPSAARVVDEWDSSSSLLELFAMVPAWHARAKCAGMDPDWWFPGRGESLREAREVCATCPVKAECLEAGMGEHHGIWGGRSERDRRRMRRDRRPAA